ncbi:hypothetical protein HPDP_00326 [Candidatus Hepatincola sp. Pdp]
MITITLYILTILLIFWRKPIQDKFFHFFYTCIYYEKYKKDIEALNKEMQFFAKESQFLHIHNYRKEWIHDDYGVIGVKEHLEISFTYWEVALEEYINDLKYINYLLIKKGFNTFALQKINFYLSRAEHILSKYDDFELLIYRKYIIELYKQLNYVINEIKKKERSIYTSDELKQYKNKISNKDGIPYSIIPYNKEEREVYIESNNGVEIINSETKLFVPYTSITQIKETTNNHHKEKVVITEKHVFIIRKKSTDLKITKQKKS